MAEVTAQGRIPEAKNKPLWRVMYDAHTYGGDPSDVLLYRASRAESLLRQIACNTDPVWARQMARDFWGITGEMAHG